jgi:hypothetical protein
LPACVVFIEIDRLQFQTLAAGHLNDREPLTVQGFSPREVARDPLTQAAALATSGVRQESRKLAISVKK